MSKVTEVGKIFAFIYVGEYNVKYNLQNGVRLMSYIIKKFLAVIISVLIAVMMISFTGCNGDADDTGKNQGEVVSETAVPESGDSSEDGGTNDTDDSDDSDFDDSLSSDSGTGDKTEATLAPDKQDEVIVESDGSSPKTPGPTGKPSPKPDTKPAVTATPRPTEVPGGDYKIEVTGPASLEKGKTVEYTLKITECTYKKGFIGLDFCLDYNSDLLDFQSSETVKVPAKTWEVIHREDNNEKLTYFLKNKN